MNACISGTLSERLRVFISSAQDEENGFAWVDVRRRIKDRLSKCACLNPFILEDVASIFPSTQLYQTMVQRSDIFVLLVKGVVRPGTSKEYALAVKYHKPMLIYFLHEDKPEQSVTDLKNDIISKDRCTFQPVSNFDKIEDTVWEHIMINLILSFQDRNCSGLYDSDNSDSNINDDRIKRIDKGFASKAEISKFQSCYSYFYEMLNIGFLKKEEKEKEKQESEWHKLGCILIKWLVTGVWEISDNEKRAFISAGAQLLADKKCLQKRWNAIIASMSGDTKKAFSQEKQALKRARDAKEPEWIINNILIDCRNMEMVINDQQRKRVYPGQFQSELNSLKSMICFPVADRYLTNIYENIEKDEFRQKTASPYTELYGSNLSAVLTDLANYLFTAALYGSETHMQLSRKILAQIFDRYSGMANNARLRYEALRQFILLGEVSSFASYIETYWNDVYSFVASKSDELWKLTDYTPINNRGAMKLSVLSKLGLYFSDNEFKKAEQYLYDYSESVYWGNSEQYFETILNTINRLNENKIVQAITPIIADKRYSMGNKLSNIFLCMDLGKVSNKYLLPLTAALKERLADIISKNGDPQMIAALVNRNKELFTELEGLEGNGLSGLEKALYQINLGTEKWETVLREEIKMARDQYTKNKEGNVYYGFMYDPYSMISNIIRKRANNEAIDQLIIEEYIPLAIDVLGSSAPVQTKEPCVACLCELLGYFREKGIKLPHELKDALRNVDIEKGNDFFSSDGRKALEIRLLMAQIIAGIKDIDSLLQWCVDFGSLDIKNKIVIIDCIEQYYYHNKERAGQMNYLLLSIALQCSTESYPEIRRRAIKCLAYVNQNETASIAINKAVYDPSVRVRMTLLELCRSGVLPKKMGSSIKKSLQNDANYTIRREARERGAA